MGNRFDGQTGRQFNDRVNRSAHFLEVRGVSKRFPGVIALDGVSLTVARGEIVAVVGENGAGKSTLMKILAGIYPPDAGSIWLDGRERRFSGVSAALACGISLIHQELNLAENLSIAANLFLGREPTWGGPLHLIDHGRITRDARRLLDRVGLSAPPENIVGSLPVGQRQLVEIARALSMHVRLLILDEPTASLSARETERLFAVVEDLRRDGVSALYISHRLAEVERLADRVVVLRDGRVAGELGRGEIRHDAMVRLMVGRELKQYYVHADAGRTAGKVRLELDGIRYEGGPATPASMALRGGEIVGIAGLVGAGRTELFEAVFGLRRRVAGTVRLDGRPVQINCPADAVAAGILLVPEDRRHNGLVLELSVRDNVALPNWDQLGGPLGIWGLGLASDSQANALAETACARLQIRAAGTMQTAALLSGGNQQKVVLGKWLVRRPRVLVLDEPTRGVDVAAKSEIYALMDQQARNGVAVVMISSDLEEILGMADRVVVMHLGRVAGELPRQRMNEEAVMQLATGGWVDP